MLPELEAPSVADPTDFNSTTVLIHLFAQPQFYIAIFCNLYNLKVIMDTQCWGTLCKSVHSLALTTWERLNKTGYSIGRSVFLIPLVSRKGCNRLYWVHLFSLVYKWWTRFLRVSGLKSGGGHNILYTISPSSLSTGAHSSSNSNKNSTMVWFQGLKSLPGYGGPGSCQVTGGPALAR